MALRSSVVNMCASVFLNFKCEVMSKKFNSVIDFHFNIK